MARQRQMVKFWLDLRHSEQQWLAGVVEELRQKRQLARTIREGILLVTTLRQGDFSVLDELFPGVRQPSSVPSHEFHELLRAVHELKAHQGRAVSELPAPRLYEASSAVEISNSKSNAEAVAKNFLASVKGFASGFFD